MPPKQSGRQSRKTEGKKIQHRRIPLPLQIVGYCIKGSRERHSRGASEHSPVTARRFERRQKTFRICFITRGKSNRKPPSSGCVPLRNAIRQPHLIFEDLLHALTPPDNVQLAAGVKKYLASGIAGQADSRHGTSRITGRAGLRDKQIGITGRPKIRDEQTSRGHVAGHSFLGCCVVALGRHIGRNGCFPQLSPKAMCAACRNTAFWRRKFLPPKAA